MSIWSRIGATISGLVARGEALSVLFARDREAPERSVAFTIAVVGLGAKMAKADGQVKPAEVAAFRQVFRIAEKDEAAAARVFNLARQDVAGYDVYARRIGRMFSDRPQVLEDILEGLFQIAMADGVYHEGEEQFLRSVADLFSISDDVFAPIEARHIAGGGEDPWQILGVARQAPIEEVRKHWRDLVKANHPDTMIARGLPPETLNLATARLTKINDAWAEIGQRRRAIGTAG